MPDQLIILFDGVCNLCNNAVNFVINMDKKNNIRFAALQSEAAHKFLADHRLPGVEMQSFIFIENGHLFTRSTAALKVCRYLGGMWALMYAFIIVPAFIRDGIYNWVAKNRYRWFGQKDECMIPTPGLEAKFLN